ncbi:MAG: hypothetical protein ACUVQQ_03550 [Thermogutta sp.]
MVRSAIRRLFTCPNAGSLGWALCLLSITAVFAPAFLRGELPLFRDAANFYYPLWYYLTQQYRGGTLPLWNPYENVGAPLVANGTTAAFYPGIAIFLLPIPYPAAYAGFLVAHVMLAAWGAARLAGELGCRAATRPLAGVIYALAGPTFFQIHNPVYLVGGAWLPWILVAIRRLIDGKESGVVPPSPFDAANSESGGGRKTGRDVARSRFGTVALLAVASAMSVLGGDPQTAYHGGLVALGTWLIVSAARFLDAMRGDPKRWQNLWLSAISAGMLTAGFGVAFLLAAVQILPTWYYAAESDRLLLDKASVGRLWNVESGESAPDEVASVMRTGHADTVYNFSVPPWQWAEMLWFNFGGALLPVHERYLHAFVVEGRWWTPSLYSGVIPFLLALSAIKLLPSRAKNAESAAGAGEGDCGATASGEAIGRDAEIGKGEGSLRGAGRIWMTYLGLFAATASLGWYGPGSVINAALGAIGGEEGTAGLFYPPAGGIYWWLVRFLPGYAMFRYPGKWLPLLTISVACLAAMGLHLGGTARRRIRRLAGITVLLSAAGAAAVLSAKWLGAWDAMQVPADDIFGPFHRESAFWHAVNSFAWTAGLGLLFGLLGGHGEKPGGENRPARAIHDWSVGNRYGSLALLVMLVSAADLTLAARSLVLPVRPPSLPPELSQTPPRRVWRAFYWYPDEWKRQSSLQRLQELADWDRQTSFGRWGMLQGIANVQHYGTMMPVRYRAFLDAVKVFMEKIRLEEPPDEILKRLGAERFERSPREDAGLAKEGEPAPHTDCKAVDPCGRPAFLNAWQEVRLIPRSGGWSISAALWDDAAAFFFPGGAPRGTDGPAVIEIADPEFNRHGEDEPPRGEHEASDRATNAVSLQCLEYAPGDVRVRVTTAVPGLVVFPEQYLTGWRVEVESGHDGTRQTADLVCVDRLFLGCLLPPGDWIVRWCYRQPGLRWGTWISAVSWLSLAVTAMALKLPSSHRFRPLRCRDAEAAGN